MSWLNFDETLLDIVKTCFISRKMSPELLHKATGVDIDICSIFFSHSIAENLSQMERENKTLEKYKKFKIIEKIRKILKK